MPKRLVVASIRLAREAKDETTVINGVQIKGKKAVTIVPKIGEVFDFSAAELDFINEHAPRSIRHPRNDEEDLASTVQVNPESATDATGKSLAGKDKTDDKTAGL